jgi:hypothetical protein
VDALLPGVDGGDLWNDGELVEVIKVGDEGVEGVDANGTGFFVNLLAFMLNGVCARDSVGAVKGRLVRAVMHVSRDAFGGLEGAARGVVLVKLAKNERGGGVNNGDLSGAGADVVLVAEAEDVSPVMGLHLDGVLANLGGVELDVAVVAGKVVLALRVRGAVGVGKDVFDAVAREDTIVSILEAKAVLFAVRLAVLFEGLLDVGDGVLVHLRDKSVRKQVVLFPEVAVHGLHGGVRDAGESLHKSGAAERSDVIAHDHGELNRLGLVAGVVDRLVPKEVLATHVPVNVAALRAFFASVHGVARGSGNSTGGHSLGEGGRVREYTSPLVTHDARRDVTVVVIESLSGRNSAR